MVKFALKHSQEQPQPLSAVPASSALGSSCWQPLCSSCMVGCLPALLTACGCWCLSRWAQLCAALPSAKASSASVVEGLQRNYLQTATGLAQVLGNSTKPHAGVSVWAATRSVKPPREDFYLQSAGFKMLGEDSNILDESRECCVKDE